MSSIITGRSDVPTDKVCGGCTLCCRLLGVKELDKPANEWCRHCDKGNGCMVHEKPEQPASCREFQCVWLQDRRGAMADDLRPDRCGVVFTTKDKGNSIVAYMRPDQEPKAVATGFIDRLVKFGIEVTIIRGTERRQLIPGRRDD